MRINIREGRTPAELKVLDAGLLKDGARCKDLQVATGLKSTVVYHALHSMRSDGIVIVKNESNQTVYKLKDYNYAAVLPWRKHSNAELDIFPTRLGAL